ncbi:MAG: hypothetical protein WC394_04230 [Candidatus Omnitrophota bacterium]|jgi:hypothetical protein
MRSKFDKSNFAKLLEEAPFISYAAKKTGIARATIYRWKKNNQDFRDAINKNLESGRRHLCDIAEMALVEKIKSKDLGAIKFYLQYNDERYRPVRTTYIPPPSSEIKLKPAEYCGICGAGKLSGLSDEELLKQLIDILEADGYTVIKPKDDIPETFISSK